MTRSDDTDRDPDGADHVPEPRTTVSFYIRQRWLKTTCPISTFDPNGTEPPLTMADAPLDSRIWIRGKAGTGPFERVLVRRPEE